MAREKIPTSQKTQADVFREFQIAMTKCAAKDRKDWSAELKKEQTTIWAARLYDPRLKGPLHFYAQDHTGLPMRKVPTMVPNSELFYSTLLLFNRFEETDWESQDRYPEDYVGEWPPRQRADLLGYRGQRAFPSGKHISYLKPPKAQWYDPKPQDWWLFFEIRFNEHTGYGMYAREWLAGKQWLGQYTGKLRPKDATVPDEETQYNFEISIGKLQENERRQPRCWVDATREGSVFRFMAHSCEPNAAVEERVDAQDERILGVYSIRDIQANEAVTIDYGMGWFAGDQDCVAEDMDLSGAVLQKSKKEAIQNGKMRKSKSSRPDHQDKNRKRVAKPKRKKNVLQK
ncbi:hypothetical protein E8E13_000940 [Curvularia kusanoi]|uniref:SET domain-containing protein n=1 Tax=Curvularia kusanoi TaxID=90978 RepID=A0A9P4W5M3_CURKU|nr:hypothetical protein E8E13_000940 [Curvularia kusanoi]